MLGGPAVEAFWRAEVSVLDRLSTALSRGERLLSVVPRSVEVVEAMVTTLAGVGGA
jgi:hypothetical protein